MHVRLHSVVSMELEGDLPEEPPCSCASAARVWVDSDVGSRDKDVSRREKTLQTQARGCQGSGMQKECGLLRSGSLRNMLRQLNILKLSVLHFNSATIIRNLHV